MTETYLPPPGVLAPDTIFSVSQHTLLDKINPVAVLDATTVDYVQIVANIIRAARTFAPRLLDLDPASIETLLQNEAIGKVVRQAVKEGRYESVRNLVIYTAVLRYGYQPLIQSHAGEIDEGAIATVKSWSQGYIGNAADALYKAMQDLSHVRRPYARFVSIVQSSGMGKSRAVDELSKSHFTIPISLRPSDDRGFPPADEAARCFLTEPSSDPAAPLKRAQAFLIALFLITADVLRGVGAHMVPEVLDKLETDALKFRSLMTKGQSFIETNVFRRNFFQRVVVQAKELMATNITEIIQGKDTSKKEPASPTISYCFNRVGLEEQTLFSAASSLASFLASRQTHGHQEPILILAFDEAHVLNEEITVGSVSPLIGLRKALRIIRTQPIFTVFLSTTGKIRDFTPPPSEDPSGRLSGGDLKLFPPFTELGFDQFARAQGIAKKGADIEEMARPEAMAMFGRPLFGSRYLSGAGIDKEDIVGFAADKLTCKRSEHKDQVILACLAVRLALQFNSSTTEVREIEKQQVEKHLRVCMLVDDGFDGVVTVAPSEPLVAEAARDLMLDSNYRFSMPSALLDVLEIPGMDKGNRGELAAEVIILKAYDSAYTSTAKETADGPRKETRTSTLTSAGRTRAVKLLTFIKHLLNIPDLNLSSIRPTKARTKTEGKSSFKHTFSNSWIYFNHFVKVDDAAVINREFLWRLILRGAGVICADNQGGSDIILPFLIRGKKIEPNNVAVLAGQIKNDATFTTKPKVYLFDGMNPFWLRVFDEEMLEKPPPIIRMVFALASPEPTVTFITPEERGFLFHREAKEKAALKISRRKASPAYTTFDIWCAKASHETFRAIEKEEEGDFAKLLKIKKTFPAAYSQGVETDLHRQNLRKQMNPGTGTSSEHWRYLSGEGIPEEVVVPNAKYYYEDDEMDGGETDEEMDGGQMDEEMDGERMDEEMDGEQVDEEMDGEEMDGEIE